MDDYCKQAKIFTNKSDAAQHRIDHSRKLHRIYEKSLENATKNYPVLPEVFGMDDFLRRDDDDKKSKMSNVAQAGSAAQNAASGAAA